MSLKIEKIHLNCCWEWNIFNNDCVICRDSICENNDNKSDKQKGSVIGVCGHAFHDVCISGWIKKKKVCPLCNKKWEYQKN